MFTMTEEQLRDIAYLTATGNHLTENFNFKHFQEIDVNNFLWEPLEHWIEEKIVEHITVIAEEFITRVKGFQNVDF